MHDPLAHAAGHLVRVLLQPPLGLGDPHRLEQRQGEFVGVVLGDVEVLAERLGDLLADLHDRVQRGHRVLEHHRHLCAPERTATRRSMAVTRSRGPRSVTVPARITFRFGSRPMIERDSTVLPEPDSPTTPRVLPRSRVKDHAVHRADDAALGVEVGAQVDHLSSGPSAVSGSNRSVPTFVRRRRVLMSALAHSALSRTSNLARTTSPRKLSASTVTKMTSDGASTMLGASLMSLTAGVDDVAPGDDVRIHAGADDARPASATIAMATPSSAIESMAGSTLGRTSRIMIRRCLAPWARAASDELTLGPASRSRLA